MILSIKFSGLNQDGVGAELSIPPPKYPSQPRNPPCARFGTWGTDAFADENAFAERRTASQCAEKVQLKTWSMFCADYFPGADGKRRQRIFALVLGPREYGKSRPLTSRTQRIHRDNNSSQKSSFPIQCRLAQQNTLLTAPRFSKLKYRQGRVEIHSEPF